MTTALLCKQQLLLLLFLLFLNNVNASFFKSEHAWAQALRVRVFGEGGRVEARLDPISNLQVKQVGSQMTRSD